MADNEQRDHDDETLDPAMERVRRKMVRLLAVAIGTMMVGLFAVLSAVIYKANEGTSAPVSAGLDIPAGFQARSVALENDRIALFGEAAQGDQAVLVFDTQTGALITNYALNTRAMPSQ